MEFLNQIIVACGYIGTIAIAVKAIYGIYKSYKKPTDDLESRVDSIESNLNKKIIGIEKKIEEIDRKLDSDYRNINSNREDMNLLMRSMFCLIENKLTGNNIDGLKKTREDLLNALTGKKEV